MTSQQTFDIGNYFGIHKVSFGILNMDRCSVIDPIIETPYIQFELFATFSSLMTPYDDV